MLVYLIFAWFKVFLSLVMLVVISSVGYKCLLFTQVIDFSNRLFLNDFYISCCHFFWTSLWYLPIFFFSLCLFRLLSSRGIVISLVLLLFTVTYSFLFLLREFYFNNVTVDCGSTFPSGINVLLLNSVNKLHPLVLYSSTLLFFAGPLVNYIYFNGRVQVNYWYALVDIRKTKQSTVAILSALFLGSWWALQEGSWGGWWNWDVSEVFGLLICFKLVVLFHTAYYFRWSKLYTLGLLLTYCSLSTFYLFMQTNFSFISHNFGFATAKFMGTEIFLLFALVIHLGLYMLVCMKKLKLITSIDYKFNSTLHIIPTLIVALLILLIYLSLLLLVNDFAWINFQLNLLNFKISFTAITLVVILVVCCIIFKLNAMSYLLVTFVLFWVNLRLCFLFIAHSIKPGSSIFHYGFLICFMVTTLTSFTANSLWVWGGFTPVLEPIFLVTTNLNFVDLITNTLSAASSCEGKSFDLVLSEGLLDQNFYPSDTSVACWVSICDMATPQIMPLVLYSALFLVSFFWSKALL